jgi:hypothetical protein
MSLEELPYRFRVRGGTAADLATVNEVLLRRELCIELDTGRMKLGDGVTAWNDLTYSGGGDGAPVEFQASATHIQWRPVGAPDWIDLVPLSDLKGANGREVELGATATHLVWRLAGDASWVNLVALADIRGADGRSVELQKSTTHIQWRLVGDASWVNLVALSDLQGPAGADAVGAATRATATFSTGTSEVAIGKTALLLAISCTAAARVRFYCTAAARSADAGRTATTAAAQGAGLLLEFIATAELLAAPLTPGIVAYNLDSTVVGQIYANVQPTAGSASATLTYLKLET